MTVLDAQIHFQSDTSRQSPAMGTVTIVGAGAGDAGDLTLRALAAIQAADVVFYDDLVDASVLALIPAHVERVFVGKRAGQPSTPQADIHDVLVRAAHNGRRAVRLKGGDPFIFGRGAEEADALYGAGVEAEIVPGLTAALVCAAGAGIPLTDRRHAAQVTFVTATRSDGSLTDLRGLAGPGRTLVIYMGARVAANIATALLQDGVSADLPAAVIENGGRANQRVADTTLGGLIGITANAPALLIVGDVVQARITPSKPRHPFKNLEIRHG